MEADGGQGTCQQIKDTIGVEFGLDTIATKGEERESADLGHVLLLHESLLGGSQR